MLMQYQAEGKTEEQLNTGRRIPSLHYYIRLLGETIKFELSTFEVRHFIYICDKPVLAH